MIVFMTQFTRETTSAGRYLGLEMLEGMAPPRPSERSLLLDHQHWEFVVQDNQMYPELWRAAVNSCMRGGTLVDGPGGWAGSKKVRTEPPGL